MNCTERQGKIALFVGGDLEQVEAVEVAKHIAECAECRAAERDLSDATAMLLSLRTVADDEVAVVRANVLRKVASPRRPVLAWLPYAAAVAMLAVGWVVTRPGVESPKPPPISAAAPRIAPLEPIKPVKSRESKRAVKPVRRKVAAPPAQQEETVVTLFTDDPDVVIVWITD